MQGIPRQMFWISKGFLGSLLELLKNGVVRGVVSNRQLNENIKLTLLSLSAAGYPSAEVGVSLFSFSSSSKAIFVWTYDPRAFGEGGLLFGELFYRTEFNYMIKINNP